MSTDLLALVMLAVIVFFGFKDKVEKRLALRKQKLSPQSPSTEQPVEEDQVTIIDNRCPDCNFTGEWLITPDAEHSGDVVCSNCYSKFLVISAAFRQMEGILSANFRQIEGILVVYCKRLGKATPLEIASLPFKSNKGRQNATSEKTAKENPRDL